MGHRIGDGACAAAAEAAGDEARLNRLDELDDTQPLWRLLTKHTDEDTLDVVTWQTERGPRSLRGDSLFVVIKRMTEVRQLARASDLSCCVRPGILPSLPARTTRCVVACADPAPSSACRPQMHNEFVREVDDLGVAVSERGSLKPLELRHTDIALGDIRPREDLRVALHCDDPEKLEESLLHLDQYGMFAKIVQRHWRNDSKSFCMAAVQQDVSRHRP